MHKVSSNLKSLGILSHPREVLWSKMYHYQNNYNVSFHQSNDYLVRRGNNFNFNNYIDEINNYVIDNNIDSVFAARDFSDLISSIVYKENENHFQFNKAPSIESILICLHKPLARYFCDIVNPKKYKFFKMSKYDSLFKCNELLQDVGGIGIIKPPLGTTSVGCKKISNSHNLLKYIKDENHNIQKSNYIFAELLKRESCQHLTKKLVRDLKENTNNAENDGDLYDLTDYCLIEEYTPQSDVMFTVDGLVYDSNVYPLFMVQNKYWETKSDMLFKGCVTPSILIDDKVFNDRIQTMAFEQYKKIIGDVLVDKFNFNNSWINIEFLGYKDCENKWRLHVQEINGRSFYQMTPIYRKLYNFDILETQIKMNFNQLNINDMINNIINRKCNDVGINGYIHVIPQINGDMKSDIDYNMLQSKAFQDFSPYIIDPNNEIATGTEDTQFLGYLNVTGNGWKDCDDKFKDALKKICVNENCMPWLS